MTAEPSTRPQLAAIDPTQPHLLLVDDDPDAHVILLHQLKRLGITTPVAAVYNGREAITLIERARSGAARLPALMFLDVRMPGMSGFDVLAWLRDHQLLGELAVVMLSSSDEPEDIRRAMSLGAHSYLTKPPRPELLRELIGSTLRLAQKRPGNAPDGSQH